MDSAFLTASVIGKPAWFWLAFLTVVIALLALDLGLFHTKARKPKVMESIYGTAFYVAVACAFGAFIWYQLGEQKALEYFTGYVMEQSLSLDNVFVISVIFSSLSIPVQYQHRVLFWGILSVLVLRGLMIGLGAALISQFHWVLVIFGVFLLFSGWRMFFSSPEEQSIEDNKLLKWMRKHLHVTRVLHGSKFFVMQRRQLYVTPLLVVLVLVEIADVVFAVDSVPAVFAVTQDPYIVYTSNIFAILGLRTLYFTLAAMVNRFEYLTKSLSGVLVFIGGKIIYTELTHKDISTGLSLAIVLSMIVGGVVVSLWASRKKETR